MGTTRERFWPRRLRWRLLGAWRWPLFVALTVADGLIIKALPPFGASSARLVPALIIAGFGNLFLLGAVAPWLGRRLAARDADATPSFPPASHVELVVDRVAAALLVLATIGLVAAGLGNRKVVVAVTDRVARASEAARGYVDAHGTPELRANDDALNAHRLSGGLFRMCVPYNDRLKAYCMYVDADRRPPTVRRDGDTRPNGQLFHEP